MESFAVICKNIKKSYGEGDARVEALRGVNLEVKEGEFLILMGPSGSGKTTLISIIAGILSQDEGDCLVSNISLNQLPEQKKTFYRGKHIGFVFQAFNLIPMLTCEENVSIPLILNGVDKKQALERATQLLIDLGLKDKLHSFPNRISGGQEQRVAIARAMSHNPDLIVCDEPTSNLDHQTGAKVMELLQTIVREQRKTLIVVSHDQRITHFADRIAYLEDGRIIQREGSQ